MGSYTRHWGSFVDPLVNIEGVSTAMLEVAYKPARIQGWQFIGAIASDYSNLIGNNVGGMLSIRKTGFLAR